MTCPTSWRSWALLARSSRSQVPMWAARRRSSARRDLLGDRLAGVSPQAAASARLLGCAQPAQRLPQVIGRAEQQGLERVHRGGAGGAGLGAGGEQDPQPLPGTDRIVAGRACPRPGRRGRPAAHQPGRTCHPDACWPGPGVRPRPPSARSRRSARVRPRPCERVPSTAHASRGPGVLQAGPGQQHRTALRISRDGDRGDLQAQLIQQAGGVRVGVGVERR